MIIKNIILLVLFVLCSVASVNAQFTVGIFGGVNNSNLIGDSPPGSTYQSKQGYAAGALVEYDITSDVRISLQPMFQRKGTTIAYSVFNEREPQDSIDININYFSIPILAKVYGGNNMLYVSGGFDIGYKLDASFKRIGSGTEKNISDSFDDFDIAAIIGVGAQFKISLFYIFIEGRYSQGLGNISSPVEGEPEELNPSFRTAGLQLYVGLTYTFGGNEVDD
jgi:hypothetical protein